ncbi:MAG: S8 family serine peptidase [Ruminococcus sp.]
MALRPWENTGERHRDAGSLALKVLDRYGNGSQEDVLRAIRWIREYRQQYRIRVVNISVGTTCNSKKDHVRLVESVEQLWDEGMVVVTAAGKPGSKAWQHHSTRQQQKVITVGSSDLLEGRSAISGRGPTTECVCKPDIVAPGNRIMSCVPGKPFSYGVKSGTSMSTPWSPAPSPAPWKGSRPYQHGYQNHADEQRRRPWPSQKPAGLGTV